MKRTETEAGKQDELAAGMADLSGAARAFGAQVQSRAQVRLLSRPSMCFYTRPIKSAVFIVFGVKEPRERKGKRTGITG